MVGRRWYESGIAAQVVDLRRLGYRDCRKHHRFSSSQSARLFARFGGCSEPDSNADVGHFAFGAGIRGVRCAYRCVAVATLGKNALLVRTDFRDNTDMLWFADFAERFGIWADLTVIHNPWRDNGTHMVFVTQ